MVIAIFTHFTIERIMNFILQPWQLYFLILAGWVNRQQQFVIEYLLTENPTWGYDRVQGALASVGYHISDTTVGNVLKAHDIEPTEDRKRQSTWATFLKAHWDVMAAIDFTTVEVWTRKGLVTFSLLFVMELKSRRVHFAACTTTANEDYMRQIAKNLTDAEDGFLNDKRYLIMDRDPRFSTAFRSLLKQADVEPVRLPPRSPNLNAYMERWMRSLKSETLDRMIFFGENSLRRAVIEFIAHYHKERNHQGVDNQIVEPGDEVGAVAGKIECRERLGGMLKYYYRDAS